METVGAYQGSADWNAQVDRVAAHFELRYGSADQGSWDTWLPVARVGRPIRRKFPVQFLITAGDRDEYTNIIEQARKEIRYYLVESREPNLWGYAQHHCGTAANAYSSIHWSYFPGPGVDLFWKTRYLTRMREDHLTCFLAAALEQDARFRLAYEHCVLQKLTVAGIAPSIEEVEVQPSFKEANRRPDLRLWLSDGRQVVCEHKLDAPEGVETEDEGDIKRQIAEYLALPVDGVAYFRTSIASSTAAYLKEPRYLHPMRPFAAPHFLWRDLHDPLVGGDQPMSRWLLAGFKRLGFTPPLYHVGELWPDDSEEVRERQRNFGKLWGRTRAYASTRWDVDTGRRCELYLRPWSSAAVVRVYVSPIAQDGSLLRFRATVGDQAQRSEVRRRLEAAIVSLPVTPEVVEGGAANNLFVDLLTPLYLLLDSADTPEKQGERLFLQVSPILDALMTSA